MHWAIYVRLERSLVIYKHIVFTDFTEASSVYDTTGMSKHRLESHINAYYLD